MARTKYTHPQNQRLRPRVTEGTSAAMLANIAEYVEETDAARDLVGKTLENILDTLEKMDDRVL